MQPIVIRLLGATLPARPRTDDGTMYGKLIAPKAVPAVCTMNRRRLIRRPVAIVSSPFSGYSITDSGCSIPDEYPVSGIELYIYLDYLSN
jgi:hypothetical protein